MYYELNVTQVRDTFFFFLLAVFLCCLFHVQIASRQILVTFEI